MMKIFLSTKHLSEIEKETKLRSQVTVDFNEKGGNELAILLFENVKQKFHD